MSVHSQQVVFQDDPYDHPRNNSDDDDSDAIGMEFYPIPPKRAAEARYPKGCTVLIAAVEGGTRCPPEPAGVVLEVGIDLACESRSNCYKVLLTKADTNDKEERYYKEDDLRFAPATPVWLTLANTVPKAEVRGVVQSGFRKVVSSDTKTNTGVWSYTVEVVLEGNSICYADIRPELLRFRPPEPLLEPPLATLEFRSNARNSISSEALSESSDMPAAAADSKKATSPTPRPSVVSLPSIKTDPGLVGGQLLVPAAAMKTHPPVQTTYIVSQSSLKLIPRPKSYTQYFDTNVNLQPNPFRYLAVCRNHSLRQAVKELEKLPTGRSGAWDRICLSYHLFGFCSRRACKWSNTHRDLDLHEANNFELSLQHVTGPLGPIVARSPSVECQGLPENASQLEEYRRTGQNVVAKNRQRPSPFSKIDMARMHAPARTIQTALRLILVERGQSIPTILYHFCWDFHLHASCDLGLSCPQVANHRDLTNEEAFQIEEALDPIISSQEGPIFANPECGSATNNVDRNQHPNPFCRIQVGPGHNYRAIYDCLHKQQTVPIILVLKDVCLNYHLGGKCEVRLCRYSKFHKPLAPAQAEILERALWPLIEMQNGAVVTRPEETTGEGPSYGSSAPIHSALGTGFCQPTGKISLEAIESPGPSESMKRSPSYFGDNSIDSQPKRSRCSDDSPPQVKRVAKKISTPIRPCIKVEPGSSVSIKLDLSTASAVFGIEFFQDLLVGERGGRQVVDELGREYSCTISCVGIQGSSVPPVVKLVGGNPECMQHCCEELERRMVNALDDPTLRGFLLFLLANRNQHYRTVKSNICHVPFSRECEESNMGETAFLTIFGVAKNPDARRSILSVDEVVDYAAALEKQFPSCLVRVYQQNTAYPSVKSFVLIAGSDFEEVHSCRQTIKVLAS